MLSKSEQTKLFIIQKTAPLFNQKGYAATSMNDILQATGMAKGGIYGHFESKESIAVEAFNYAYRKLLDALTFKIKQEKTAAGKLNAILKFHKNYTQNPLIPGGCPLLNTGVGSSDHLPFLKEKVARAMKEMLHSLKYIIQKGIDKGEFNKKLNATSEAQWFFATIEGGIMMSQLSGNPLILNNLLTRMQNEIGNW